MVDVGAHHDTWNIAKRALSIILLRVDSVHCSMHRRILHLVATELPGTFLKYGKYAGVEPVHGSLGKVFRVLSPRYQLLIRLELSVDAISRELFQDNLIVR